ncbi:MAG TPA: glucose-6-phosphate isomerase family protein [Candidatus Moranbacteria bacterium]|nr:glucose-6-phosphate isomerase family protein [Candidatus Moranbacteria bacterium]
MQINFEFVPKHYAAREHEEMKDVLMDPNGIGPAIHYYMIRGGVEQKNVTVWEPGTISGEYIKTYGHYHVGQLEEDYDILFGEGIALLQKLSVDENGNMIADCVEEFKAIITKPGDKIHMGPGYGHLLVNTGLTYFITADTSPVNFDEKNPVDFPGHADYEPVKKMRGFAYYVIENNGKPALKRNPNYKKILNEDLGGLEIIG